VVPGRQIGIDRLSDPAGDPDHVLGRSGSALGDFRHRVGLQGASGVGEVAEQDAPLGAVLLDRQLNPEGQFGDDQR
jgi:hypothetical protein